MLKAVLIGGPGDQQAVQTAAGAQSFQLQAFDGAHRYVRKHWAVDEHANAQAFFVHPDLSEGEAEALIRLYLGP
jgi:hypothetical protein